MSSPDDDSRVARHRRRKAPVQQESPPPAAGAAGDISRKDRLARRKRGASERRRLVLLYGLAVLVAFLAVLGGWWVTARLFGGGGEGETAARLTLITLTDPASGKATAMALAVRDEPGSRYALYVIPPELLLLGPNGEYVFAGDSLATGHLEEDLERVIGVQVDGAYVLPATALADLAGKKVLTAGLDRPVTVLQDGRERAHDETMVVMAEELPGLFTPSEAGGWDNTTVQEGLWRAVLAAAAERPEGEREAALDALAAAAGAADAAPLAELVQGLTKGDAAVARMPSTSRVAEGQFAFVPDQDQIMAAVTRKGSGYSSPYTVVIRNGSGKVGIGTAVAERLAVLNVILPQPTNADRFNYGRTRILVGDGAVTVGEDIRAILGRGVVLKGTDVPANTVVVIVGDDVKPADLKPKDQQ